MYSKRNQAFDECYEPEPNTGCWLWLRGASHGYGTIHIPGENRRVPAHRFSYERVNGPIPRGMHVCHKCDNPPCVNPDHLFLGTHLDNVADKVRKGRAKGHGGPPGERCSLSRLNSEQVLEIRRRYAQGGVSQSVLAAEFGVKQPNISEIIIRKTWKHL